MPLLLTVMMCSRCIAYSQRASSSTQVLLSEWMVKRQFRKKLKLTVGQMIVDPLSYCLPGVEPVELECVDDQMKSVGIADEVILPS